VKRNKYTAGMYGRTKRWSWKQHPIESI